VIPPPGTARTLRWRAVPGWLLVVTVGAVVAAPLVVTASSLLDPNERIWRNLWRTRLPGMITQTALLLVCVVGGTLVLGTGLAWLISSYRFPGRRLLGWLLVTPLAMPAYVLGFVWLDTLQQPLGARGVRNIWVCAAVLTLSLYPYVYLFARAAFSTQSGRYHAAARSLGASETSAFWRVHLPMARPAVVSGASLVAMEVLTDIGTVRLFNVSTVADGVLRVWFDLGNRNAAAEVALILVGTAVLLITLERLLRGRARFTHAGGSDAYPPRSLGAAGTAATMAAGTGVLALAVGVPMFRLVALAGDARASGATVSVAGDLSYHLGNSGRIAAVATLVCMGLGTALAVSTRSRGTPGRIIGRAATLGYAVPGPVVAIGAVITLAGVDRRGLFPGGALLVGSMVGLIYALVVRFLAVAYQGVTGALDGIAPTMADGARALGAGPLRTASRVQLPLARSGIIAATALVCIDTLKELPVTLLLRPFGNDTLAVWVWQATSESLWAQAAVPSLALVVAGMVPVAVLLWALERGAAISS
jgi:iron(III) transport system permease protein